MAETQTAAKKPNRTPDQIKADFEKEHRARLWREKQREASGLVAELAKMVRAAESTVDIAEAVRAFNADMEGVIPTSPATSTEAPVK